MSTGTGTGSGTYTAAVTRTEILIQQINAIVEGTTASATFKKVLQIGIENCWIAQIFVRGLTSQERILQQIEIEIDWQEHLVRVKDPQQSTIEVRLDTPERNRLSRIVPEIIDGFNEITQLKGLKPEWSVVYTPETNREEANRILGLVPSGMQEWVPGRIEDVYSPYKLKKLPELQLAWRVVTED